MEGDGADGARSRSLSGRSASGSAPIIRNKDLLDVDMQLPVYADVTSGNGPDFSDFVESARLNSL